MATERTRSFRNQTELGNSVHKACRIPYLSIFIKVRINFLILPSNSNQFLKSKLWEKGIRKAEEEKSSLERMECAGLKRKRSTLLQTPLKSNQFFLTSFKKKARKKQNKT